MCSITSCQENLKYQFSKFGYNWLQSVLMGIGNMVVIEAYHPCLQFDPIKIERSIQKYLHTSLCIACLIIQVFPMETNIYSHSLIELVYLEEFSRELESFSLLQETKDHVKQYGRWNHRLFIYGIWSYASRSQYCGMYNDYDDLDFDPIFGQWLITWIDPVWQIGGRSIEKANMWSSK